MCAHPVLVLQAPQPLHSPSSLRVPCLGSAGAALWTLHLTSLGVTGEAGVRRGEQAGAQGWDVRSFTRTGAVSTGDSRCRCAGTCCHEHGGEHEAGREETACGAQRALCWRQRVPQGRAPSRHHCAAHASACPCPAVPSPALPHSGSAPQPTRPAGLGRGATWGRKGRAQGTRGAGQRAGSVHCGTVLGAFSAAGAAACAALVHSAVPVLVPEVSWCGASTTAVLVLSSVPVLVLRAVLVLGAVPVLSAMPVRGAVPVLGAVPVPGAVPVSGAVPVPGAGVGAGCRVPDAVRCRVQRGTGSERCCPAPGLRWPGRDPRSPQPGRSAQELPLAGTNGDGSCPDRVSPALPSFLTPRRGGAGGAGRLRRAVGGWVVGATILPASARGAPGMGPTPLPVGSPPGAPGCGCWSPAMQEAGTPWGHTGVAGAQAVPAALHRARLNHCGRSQGAGTAWPAGLGHTGLTGTRST